MRHRMTVNRLKFAISELKFALDSAEDFFEYMRRRVPESEKPLYDELLLLLCHEETVEAVELLFRVVRNIEKKLR